MDELEELEAQLKAAEAENAAARAEEAKRERIAEVRAKLQAEANAKRDFPELAKLEGIKGVDFEVVVCRLGAVAVKRPAPVLYKRFQESKQAPMAAGEQLVRACLVYPDAKAFTEILDDQPGALVPLTAACLELAGQNLEKLQGKS